MLTLLQAVACGDAAGFEEEDVELAAEDEAALDEGDDKGLLKTRYCDYNLSLVYGSQQKGLSITGSGQRFSANGARGAAFSNAIACTKAWWAAATSKGSDLAACSGVTGLNQSLNALVGTSDGRRLEMSYGGTQGACWAVARNVIVLD